MGNSTAAAGPVSSPPGKEALQQEFGGHQPTSKAWGECSPELRDLKPQAPRRVPIRMALRTHP